MPERPFGRHKWTKIPKNHEKSRCSPRAEHAKRALMAADPMDPAVALAYQACAKVAAGVDKETRAFFAPGQAELLRVAFPAAVGRDSSQFLCWILKRQSRSFDEGYYKHMQMNGMCFTPGTLAKQHSWLETIKTSRAE